MLERRSCRLASHPASSKPEAGAWRRVPLGGRGGFVQAGSSVWMCQESNRMIGATGDGLL